MAMKSHHFHKESKSLGWVGHIPTTQPGLGIPYRVTRPGLGIPYRVTQPGLGIPYRVTQPGL